MSQSETSEVASWKHDPKVRVAIQVFQLFILLMLVLQVFTERNRREKAVDKVYQAGLLTETALRREIFDLNQKLEKAEARVKELEKAAVK